ncbi:MAG: DUF523 domain-containing protein [Clostridia bacterium]|nr:DUF523 domain-containing protein [Clostridia bacterium]
MIVVSACLVGEQCKYDGTDNKNIKVLEFLKDKEYITVCPEMMGGLPCPRIPSEIKGDRVINKNGEDVTEEFCKGACRALEKAEEYGALTAILKESSPSCGVNTIYNGEFSNTKVKGSGITASLFKEKGIKVMTEKDV